MSFWSTSSGENATDTGTEFETTEAFTLIPDGSSVMAVIDKAEWAKDNNFNNYIALRWAVMKPESVEGAKIPHKLWVNDPDPKAKDPGKKRDKALRMLAAIDANCGGKLSKLSEEPTDDELALALMNKPMVIRVQTWSLQGDNGPIEGNWISAVSPKTKALEIKAPKNAPKNGGMGAPLESDDIPF